MQFIYNLSSMAALCKAINMAPDKETLNRICTYIFFKLNSGKNRYMYVLRFSKDRKPT